MSFSVDQFMQVKCTFQLTSESDSSESILANNEQIRLCTSVNMDDNNSALIVMVCTNETGNNHVLAYYIERRQHQLGQQQAMLSKKSTDAASFLESTSIEQSQAANDDSSSKSNAVTFANLAAQSRDSPFRSEPPVKSGRVKTKSRVIVKQIYYHDYNEDIVAICLSKQGTKLVLVNASSTVYVIPIKNILLNLHAQQLRSSQGRSMYFYDASILYCAQSFADPVDVVYWESPEAVQPKSTIIMASHDGKLIFLSVEEKRVVSSTSVGEPIKSIKIMRDKYSYSLLITCKSLNQYRQTLELLDKSSKSSSAQQANEPPRTVISLPQSMKSRKATQKPIVSIEEQARQPPSWSSRPLPIKPLSHQTGASSAANALQRVLLPSASRFGGQASLMSNFNEVRERSLSLIGYQEPNLISLVDVLGPNSVHHQHAVEPRLLRFYTDRQYFYQPQRPQIICKLDLLDPNELITELILTNRFIALTTDRDRCIVNSRNCSKLKNAFSAQQQDLSPLVKEITFNHEEKIMLLIRSPAINDPDDIIDSFLLVTTRSIYSIEARHGCRELFINLIDSHLAIKRTLFMSRPRPELETAPYSLGRMITSASENHLAFELNNSRLRTNYETSRNAESNLLINSFLQHRDAYERVCHDSQAFSTLFKVELSSLYEAYADRLLQRGQLELANRFFQMASFDHVKILGKYIRFGAFKETIDYVRDLLDDENNFRAGMLGEGERIELAKMAFECLLAKTIVERSKVSLYKTARTSRSLRNKLLNATKSQLKLGRKQPPDIQEQQQPAWSSPALRGLNPFSLCEHSPRGQDARLSATTIVPCGQEDEDTLTSNTGGGGTSEQQRNHTLARTFRTGGKDRCDHQVRLECEKNLLYFMRNLMPTSMFEYTIDQLLDFDLIEFIDLITQADVQILSFIKMVIRYRDEDRLVFRAGRFQPLLERLARVNQADLVKVSIEKDEFLEFLTSPKVTRALVKDIGLTCEYYNYQHTRVQFRKFSFAALRHLETYRQLARAQSERAIESELAESEQSDETGIISTAGADDDNANDGLNFSKRFERTCTPEDDGRTVFNRNQRQNVENIFIEFLTACLYQSIEEDSCRLWYNYVNFYLNYVGSLEDLQSDILRLVDTLEDYRLAKSLYRAIHRDELLLARDTNAKQKNSTKKSNSRSAISNFKISKNQVDSKAFLKENMIANTPLEHMKKLYSLANLFENGFLMKLLYKTLDLMPHSVVRMD